MKRRVQIRFHGTHDEAWYGVILGPIETLDPDQRELHGGDEVWVGLSETPERPGCVDLVFDDGEIALEYPSENFTVIREE